MAQFPLLPPGLLGLPHNSETELMRDRAGFRAPAPAAKALGAGVVQGPSTVTDPTDETLCGRSPPSCPCTVRLSGVTPSGASRSPLSCVHFSAPPFLVFLCCSFHVWHLLSPALNTLYLSMVVCVSYLPLELKVCPALKRHFRMNGQGASPTSQRQNRAPRAPHFAQPTPPP